MVFLFRVLSLLVQKPIIFKIINFGINYIYSNKFHLKALLPPSPVLHEVKYIYKPIDFPYS